MNLMHKTLLAAAVCALLPAAALAKDVMMPRDLPAYGADKPLPVPDIEKKTLANGLEVWVLPRDGVPRVDYVLAVRGAGYAADDAPGFASRSEEHTSELQSLMRLSYAVFCLK